jgi:hypothetical protein
MVDGKADAWKNLPLDTSAGFGKRARMRFRATPLPLPVAGPGLSTTLVRASCLGGSRPSDDSTDPEPRR